MEELTELNGEVHNRVIVHIDMDYFYAQVEEVHDPSLKEKPFGVQQKNSVVTANYKARELGVQKMMTVSNALKICPELVLINGEDLTKYRQMSVKIFEILHKFTSMVEKLGFDENYLDVTDLVAKKLEENYQLYSSCQPVGVVHPPENILDDCKCGCSTRLAVGTHIAKDIRDEIWNKLGMTCSAGVSHNKLLAKLVGSFNKPNNQTVLVASFASSFMRDLSCLRKITGVGEKTEALLEKCNIRTVEDLQNCDFDILKRKLGYDTACKIKELSFGRDPSTVRPSGKPKSIGLEDSCRPISVRKDVEERFRLLLMRLVNQVSEDGRIPVTIKIMLRKFDAKKKTSHRETKQANILPSLFRQMHDGQIMLADGAQDKLLKIIMRLFERIVDMAKPFNITLLGLAFSKFQEKRLGSSSIANFLIKKADLEVQSVTSLCSDGSVTNSEPADDYYRRRTTASPMVVDFETTTSDPSDFSEPEVEPLAKKTRLGLIISKRRCLSTCDTSDIESPSKLRVSELRLNSRDNEKETIKDFTMANASVKGCNTNIQPKDVLDSKQPSSTANGEPGKEKNEASVVSKPPSPVIGNLANIPCPSNVDPNVFKELPSEVQNELISSWRNSLASKTNSNTHPNGAASTNTLHRYFIKYK